jgi:hypothetical protein
MRDGLGWVRIVSPGSRAVWSVELDVAVVGSGFGAEDAEGRSGNPKNVNSR